VSIELKRCKPLVTFYNYVCQMYFVTNCCTFCQPDIFVLYILPSNPQLREKDYICLYLSSRNSMAKQISIATTRYRM
jgi:hypothetical protein